MHSLEIKVDCLKEQTNDLFNILGKNTQTLSQKFVLFSFGFYIMSEKKKNHEATSFRKANIFVLYAV